LAAYRSFLAFIYETELFDLRHSHAFLKVVNRLVPFRQEEVAMTCIWNGVRLPLIAAVRLWRRARRRQVLTLDPRLMNAHWRRDLGFDI